MCGICRRSSGGWGNNIDPQPTWSFVQGPVDVLNHASPKQGIRARKMGIDATRSGKSEGFEPRVAADIKIDRLSSGEGGRSLARAGWRWWVWFRKNADDADGMGMGIRRLVVAISGRVGASYARSLLRNVLPHYQTVYVMCRAPPRHYARGIGHDDVREMPGMAENWSCWIIRIWRRPRERIASYDGWSLFHARWGAIGRIAGGRASRRTDLAGREFV